MADKDLIKGFSLKEGDYTKPTRSSDSSNCSKNIINVFDTAKYNGSMLEKADGRLDASEQASIFSGLQKAAAADGDQILTDDELSKYMQDNNLFTEIPPSTPGFALESAKASQVTAFKTFISGLFGLKNPESSLSATSDADSKVIQPKNGKEIAVDAWGSKDNANDCLLHIIQNNYNEDIKYGSDEYKQISEAIMNANSQIYGTAPDGNDSNRKRLGSATRDNTVLYTTDTINLPNLIDDGTGKLVKAPEEAELGGETELETASSEENKQINEALGATSYTEGKDANGLKTRTYFDAAGKQVATSSFATKDAGSYWEQKETITKNNETIEITNSRDSGGSYSTMKITDSTGKVRTIDLKTGKDTTPIEEPESPVIPETGGDTQSVEKTAAQELQDAILKDLEVQYIPASENQTSVSVDAMNQAVPDLKEAINFATPEELKQIQTLLASVRATDSGMDASTLQSLALALVGRKNAYEKNQKEAEQDALNQPQSDAESVQSQQSILKDLEVQYIPAPENQTSVSVDAMNQAVPDLKEAINFATPEELKQIQTLLASVRATDSGMDASTLQSLALALVGRKNAYEKNQKEAEQDALNQPQR